MVDDVVAFFLSLCCVHDMVIAVTFYIDFIQNISIAFIFGVKKIENKL